MRHEYHDRPAKEIYKNITLIEFSLDDMSSV